MSKSLLLIRHARASSASHHQQDIDRALQYEGHAEARNLGKFLGKQNLSLDSMYCSPSLRTRQTWEGIVSNIGTALPHMSLEDRLYEASLGELTRWISTWDDTKQVLGIIAHNPAISSLGRYLDINAPVSLPPAGCLFLGLAIDHWAELTEGSGTVQWYEPPSDSD